MKNLFFLFTTLFLIGFKAEAQSDIVLQQNDYAEASKIQPKNGVSEYTIGNIEALKSEHHDNNELISTSTMIDDFSNRKFPNSATLNYLLKSPRLIPQDWLGKRLYFWGSRYVIPGSAECVAYIVWDGKKWISRLNPVDFTAEEGDYVLVVKEPEEKKK